LAASLVVSRIGRLIGKKSQIFLPFSQLFLPNALNGGDSLRISEKTLKIFEAESLLEMIDLYIHSFHQFVYSLICSFFGLFICSVSNVIFACLSLGEIGVC